MIFHKYRRYVGLFSHATRRSTKTEAQQTTQKLIVKRREHFSLRQFTRGFVIACDLLKGHRLILLRG